ncbi:MAG: DUF481 domain-containing protein [Pseudomonadales bacterium]|nr:DUF481 domain-containing protein [Pseudomonadales bacterium]
MKFVQFGLMLFLFCRFVYADTLIMKNGDQVHGRFESLTANRMIFSSENFGKLEVLREKIADLQVSVDIQLPAVLVAGSSVVTTEESCHLKNAASTGFMIDCSGEMRNFTLDQLPLMTRYLPPEKPVWKQKGSVRVAASSSSGNTDEEHWDISAKSQFSKQKHRHTIALDFENEVDNNGHSDEFYETKYAYDWFFDKNWFLNGNASYTRDVASDIDARYKLGSGIGYQFWSNENRHLEVEGGLVYVDQNYVSKGNQQTDYMAARWALDWWQRWDSLKLFHDHELVGSFEKGSDFTLETDTGIKYLINKQLYGEFKYEWDHDNLPAKGTDKNDSKWTLGVGYDW